MINPDSGVLAATEEFAVAPVIGGNEGMRIYQRMFDTDTHLEGLYRRIHIALLSSRITVDCDDKTVAEFVRNQMGIIDGRPPTKFLKFLNELVSSLQYGFSAHRFTEENTDSMGTVIHLRRIEPVDVWEFTVNGDDMVSLAEGFSEEIHGVKSEAKIRKLKNGQEVVDIPAEEILHVAPLQLGRNFYGRSIFRAAIGNWATKTMMLFCESIRQGRFSVPYIIGKLDKFDERNPYDAEAIAKAFKLPATTVDRMLVMRKGDEIETISPQGGTNLIDTVKYYDFSNSKLVLEQFVDVGDKAWGSRSTYTAGSDDFNDSLNFYEMAVVAGVHDYATLIADANFSGHPPMKAYFKELGMGRAKIMELWRDLVKDKVVRRGKNDEEFFRSSLGMPEYEEPMDGDVADMPEPTPAKEPADMQPVITTNGA